MFVQLVAKPQFLGIPERCGVPRADQMQGSSGAQVVEFAGRTCYDSLGQGRNSAEYHKHILQVAHGSVLAHANYSFFIDEVSRGLTHELVRHAVGIGISQRSTRYVDEGDSPWIMHPLILKYLQETKDQTVQLIWDTAKRECQEAYKVIVGRLQEYMIAKGMPKLDSRKQARGAARGILGNALETSLVWTANVRAWRWVISQRAANPADAEIRALGIGLLRIGQEHLPEYFTDYEVSPATDGLGEAAVSPNPKV